MTQPVQIYIVNKTHSTIGLENLSINLTAYGVAEIAEEHLRHPSILDLVRLNFVELTHVIPGSTQTVAAIEVTEHKPFTGFSFEELQTELAKDAAKKELSVTSSIGIPEVVDPLPVKTSVEVTISPKAPKPPKVKG